MLGPKPPNIFSFQILIAFSEILLACQNCNAQFLYGNNCSIGLDTYTECTGCKIIAFFYPDLISCYELGNLPFYTLGGSTSHSGASVGDSEESRRTPSMPRFVKL